MIEALVALVILSMVFATVWGWFGTAVTSTTKIERALALPEVFSQFMVKMELEPLQQITSGQWRIGEFEVRWQVKPERASNNEAYRRQRAWIVTLFAIEADIFQGGQQVTTFNTKIVKQWRDPTYVPPPQF